MADTNAPNHAQQLSLEAAAVYAQIGNRRETLRARHAKLDQLIHDAEAREHRRAAFNARDAATYRLGGAFEVVGALGLDAVALSGFLNLGALGLLLLSRIALHEPSASMGDWLAMLFGSPEGRTIRDHGVWLRWSWLRDLYVNEVDMFFASPAGKDPHHRFRRKKPTPRQTYLVVEICRCLQLEPRPFDTRGEALEWIREQGGNPRFNMEPPRPDLSVLAEAFR